MTPIKVLHLIPTLSSGGAERQLVTVIENTAKEINHVVCAINNSDFFAPEIRKAGFEVIDFNIQEKRPFLKAAKEFRRIKDREKPNIIHSWLYDANVSARLANLTGSKTPIITSLQLADYEPEAARIGNWNPHKVRGLKAIDKFTALLTKPYFVPCSEFVKNSYERYFGLDKTKTQVIYNSVSPSSLSASEQDAQKVREELNLSSDAFIYLNVGRLDPQKNHQTIFKAFKEVLSETPNAYLLLAGVGGLNENLRKLADELLISENTIFLGRRNDIAALLKLADVFVFPSFFEGLPVALVEAMFASLPCIASRIEVFKEIVKDGENGLLIDPNSIIELKNAMIRLQKDDKLRRSLGENAFQQVFRKFNIEIVAGQWKKLYSSIMSTT